MSILDNRELQNIFKEEARTLISRTRKGLVSLSKKPRGTQKSKLVFELFRCMHTLRGTAGSLGFKKIEESAKTMTEIFRSVKDGRTEIHLDTATLVMKGLDECVKELKNI